MKGAQMKNYYRNYYLLYKLRYLYLFAFMLNHFDNNINTAQQIYMKQIKKVFCSRGAELRVYFYPLQGERMRGKGWQIDNKSLTAKIDMHNKN